MKDGHRQPRSGRGLHRGLFFSRPMQKGLGCGKARISVPPEVHSVTEKALSGSQNWGKSPGRLKLSSPSTPNPETTILQLSSNKPKPYSRDRRCQPGRDAPARPLATARGGWPTSALPSRPSV